MKKLILYNSIINLMEYTIVYLIKTFIIWKFTNPIQWIIDLPKYDSGDRAGILAGIFLWQFIQLFILHGIITFKTTER